MLSSTEGIVLRKIDYSGNSVIANIYTRKFGQMGFLVRGVSRKTGKAAALLPLSRVEVCFNYKEKNRLQTATELVLLQGAAHLNLHPLKGATAIFLAEVLYKALKEESPDDELYDYLSTALGIFFSGAFQSEFHLLFLIKLSRFLGFYPSGRWSSSQPYFDLLNGNFTNDRNASLHTLKAPESEVLWQLLQADLSHLEPLMTNAMRREMLEALVDFYRIHLEGLGNIKSLAVLKEVFS